MKILILGGAGYIGTKAAEHFAKQDWVSDVWLADLKPSPLAGQAKIKTSLTDVRKPLTAPDLLAFKPDWIFNFAAVHREPGHEAHEYFDTNIAGAENTVAYAEQVGCNNLYFTSSISVYGPTNGPTDESKPYCPISPYGGSKFPAELIHKAWQSRDPANRKLVIVRPGVVYGPQDPGNIGRMISAIKKGYFAFPGSMNVKKSYAYVYGLVDSMVFTMNRPEKVIVYNYVETPTEELGTIANIVKQKVGSKGPILSIPTSVLLPAAHLVQLVAGNKNPVHPTRVRKAGMATHIVPQTLLDMGFEFKYTFASSLDHWATIYPDDLR